MRGGGEFVISESERRKREGEGEYLGRESGGGEWMRRVSRGRGRRRERQGRH